MLEGLFGGYHSSSAVLGLQRPEVTKQPLVSNWSETPQLLLVLIVASIENTKEKVTIEWIWLD